MINVALGAPPWLLNPAGFPAAFFVSVHVPSEALSLEVVDPLCDSGAVRLQSLRLRGAIISIVVIGDPVADATVYNHVGPAFLPAGLYTTLAVKATVPDVVFAVAVTGGPVKVVPDAGDSGDLSVVALAHPCSRSVTARHVPLRTVDIRFIEPSFPDRSALRPKWWRNELRGP